VKGNAKVLKHLNDVLTNELTAIDQYFLHAKMFQHWGFERLAKRERDASIDEMKHAESLMERILFLEGLPNLQNLHKLLIGEDMTEALKCD
jgi:bacterioferritin